MRLARLQHSVLNGICAGDALNVAALQAFNAGVNAILSQNRDAMDSELLALENIVDQVFEASGDAESVPSSLDGAAASPVDNEAPLGEAAGVEGGASASPGSESVTEVAPPVQDAGITVPAESEPSTAPESEAEFDPNA